MAGGVGDLVKAVVDLEREIMAWMGLHADEEALLLEHGLRNGISGASTSIRSAAEDRIEFDSMINLRPSQGNRSRGWTTGGPQQDQSREFAHTVMTWKHPELAAGRWREFTLMGSWPTSAARSAGAQLAAKAIPSERQSSSAGWSCWH